MPTASVRGQPFDEGELFLTLTQDNDDGGKSRVLPVAGGYRDVGRYLASIPIDLRRSSMPDPAPDSRASLAHKLSRAGLWLAKGLQYSPGMAGFMFQPRFPPTLRRWK